MGKWALLFYRLHILQCVTAHKYLDIAQKTSQVV
jgi:hypothetical protein